MISKHSASSVTQRHLPFARRAAPGVFLPLVAGTLALALAGGCAPSAPPLADLPTLTIDPVRVTVSGLSSGAYMAQQLHLAYSDRIAGVALLAGGPYGCARGDLRTALAECTTPDDALLPALAPLVEQVRERANDGRLAPLSGLQGDRVWVYRGSKDDIVAEQVTAASADMYEALDAGVALSRRLDLPYAHLLPVGSPGDDCSTSAAPYIARCGFDAAGEVFKQLYDADKSATDATGELRGFNQSSYAVAPDDPPGLDSGYVYLPKACLAGESCGLHIALHGCEQSSETIGDMFAARGGYNRWADAANVVVLYPQARSSLRPLNPKGCWDWWGYSGADFDTRDGAQMRWIANMAAALGAPLM